MVEKKQESRRVTLDEVYRLLFRRHAKVVRRNITLEILRQKNIEAALSTQYNVEHAARALERALGASGTNDDVSSYDLREKAFAIERQTVLLQSEVALYKGYYERLARVIGYDGNHKCFAAVEHKAKRLAGKIKPTTPLPPIGTLKVAAHYAQARKKKGGKK